VPFRVGCEHPSVHFFPRTPHRPLHTAAAAAIALTDSSDSSGSSSDSEAFCLSDTLYELDDDPAELEPRERSGFLQRVDTGLPLNEQWRCAGEWDRSPAYMHTESRERFG